MDNNTSLAFKPTEIIGLPHEVNHHDHSHNQIVIGLHGRSEFNIEGTEDLIIPGHGCTIIASSEHAFSGIDTSQLMILNLPCESTLERNDCDRMNQLFLGNTFFQLDHRLQQLTHLLSLEIQSSPDDSALGLACNNTLIALLQRRINTTRCSKQRLDMDRLDTYIIENIRRKISIAQLAGCVFLCESQFYAIFKKQTGTTPHQYILQKRFNLAKELLENGKLSLSQISDTVGFTNQSSFTHIFTKLQGISPSKYRR